MRVGITPEILKQMQRAHITVNDYLLILFISIPDLSCSHFEFVFYAFMISNRFSTGICCAKWKNAAATTKSPLSTSTPQSPTRQLRYEVDNFKIEEKKKDELR